jgi:hypothetical protein
MGERPRLVVFVRAPLLGTVKRRLATGIGAAAARDFYAAASRALLRRVGRDARWRTELWVTPDLYAVSGRFWDPALPRAPQGSGDLARRMTRAFLAGGAGPALIVGSDIPDIAPRHVAAAFRALGAADAVFGPAADGGYWLVGLRQGALARGLFDGVRWSSEHALADTLANLRGKRVAMLETLSDIDDAADLAAWRDRRRAKR